MKKEINLLVLGPQGAGKGTQALLLAQRLGIPTISVGAMYRDAIKKQTKIGKLAGKYINRGMLVPSHVTNHLMKERFAKHDLKDGVIFDGYPRNLVQARALQKYFPLTAVIWLDISDTEAKKRLLNRWVCDGCKINYNKIFSPSKLKKLCHGCGGKLARRADDTPAGIKKRLKIFHKETKPLLGFYGRLGVVIRIDGEHSIGYVQKEIVDKLSRFLKKKKKGPN